MRTLLALLLLSLPAQAQQPRCGPLESILSDLAGMGMVIEWEGFEPDKPVSTMLLVQHPRSGDWQLVRIIGVNACLIARGKAGTSIVTGQET